MSTVARDQSIHPPVPSAVPDWTSQCVGETPLTARLEPWQQELAGNAGLLAEWIDRHGSPLNLLHTAPMGRNAAQLEAVAAHRELDFQILFARKANKCLAFVDAAKEIGCGIDLASLAELQQCLAKRIPPERLMLTAAVKDAALIESAVLHDVSIAIDNADEARQIAAVAKRLDKQANAAVRVSGFQAAESKMFSRFGVEIDRLEAFIKQFIEAPEFSPYLQLEGLHFHLDSFSSEERVVALKQCLAANDLLALRGHKLRYLDMGGGLPMSYLDDSQQWADFWKELHAALRRQRDPITYRNHGLGLHADGERILGAANVYPYYQTPTAANWLAGILDAPCGDSTLAQEFIKRDLQLRCEPGRSLLDGCGMTLAKVQFVKQHPAGHALAGLAMNSTQCRTTSDDFLVDPLLIRPRSDARTFEPTAGYLVGVYCTESELLTWRKLRFPQGAAAGDLIAWPNTAGYLMHFRESRSHQFPLAKNLIIRDLESNRAALDEIDSSIA